MARVSSTNKVFFVVRQDQKRKQTPLNLPCFIITVRNFTMTFDEGRRRTCRFPRLSALQIEFRASLKTLIRTILNPETQNTDVNRSP